MSLPDVMPKDSVIDACERLGLSDVHKLFLQASIEASLNDAHGCAQTAFFIWAKDGYDALPTYIKDFCLRVCDHEYHH